MAKAKFSSRAPWPKCHHTALSRRAQSDELIHRTRQALFIVKKKD
jgi:hypothetical protein